MRRGIFALIPFLFFPASSFAQDRPLQTVDAETVAPGTLRAEIGFDFLQDVDFPLSGLNGDLTSAGVINVRMGIGKIVEIQLEGAIQNFLDIKSRGTSFVPALQLTGTNSTRDTGDFSLSTKIRILPESGKRPSLAFQFGFIMPNSNQERGIGTNTTNVFALVALEKHLKGGKLFGNLGVEILQSPNALFTQNDVLLYGGAFSVPLGRRVHVVGEVAGRHSSRKVSAALVGTESRSQARFGLQIFAGGFTWDFAGIAGLQAHDAKSGFTFGLSKDIKLFDYDRIR
jgi:hypothetical protein